MEKKLDTSLNFCLVIKLKRFSFSISMLFTKFIFFMFEEQKQTSSKPNKYSNRRASVKNKFSAEEDARLKEIVSIHGTKNWLKISKLMGTRNPRQCRERWNNYINPVLRNDSWTKEEEAILEEKFKEYGPHWNKIGKFLVNRSDNNIRNRWMMIQRHRLKINQPKLLHISKSSPCHVAVLKQYQIPNIYPPSQTNFNASQVSSSPFRPFKSAPSIPSPLPPPLPPPPSPPLPTNENNFNPPKNEFLDQASLKNQPSSIFSSPIEENISDSNNISASSFMDLFSSSLKNEDWNQLNFFY